jgi:hypothetical protein
VRSCWRRRSERDTGPLGAAEKNIGFTRGARSRNL